MALFRKILIANRGEIALRIIRSASEMGIHCIIVFSETDKNELFVQTADEAVSLGIGSLSDTYLNIDKIIQIAIDRNAEAIHPGYGFLSENPIFAEACKQKGIEFIGPSPEAIRLMGNKLEALQFVSQLGVPTLGAVTSDNIKGLITKASKLPFPLIIKAVAGGGGKGMRVVSKKVELQAAIESASREALSSFNNAQVFIEPYIENPRHIEVQVLADHFGNAIHLFDRECTIQRRHQKIIEEAPSPSLSDKMRGELFEKALTIVKAMRYTNAGTLEFLLNEDNQFYFLEMNTRIQVEHPVTEEITGIDIVKEQIKIATGHKLSYTQSDITVNGHSIECRIYAEDAFQGFMPAAGNILLYKAPELLGLRLESSVNRPVEISSDFDPMIAKLITKGTSREKAREKLVRGLSDFIIHGIQTNIDYLKEVLENPRFVENQLSTKFCSVEHNFMADAFNNKVSGTPIKDVIASLLAYHYSQLMTTEVEQPVWTSLGYWRQKMRVDYDINGQKCSVRFQKQGSGKFICSIDDENFEFSSNRNGNEVSVRMDGRVIRSFVSAVEDINFVSINNITCKVRRMDYIRLNNPGRKENKVVVAGSKLLSPLFGKVVKINCMPNDKVLKGEVIMVIESMKMENNIIAPSEGFIQQILVNTGDRVEGRELLAVLK